MRYGLIGEHLGHSYSREIHESVTGIPYELKELKPEELGAFMEMHDFCGINVTIPYKTAVLPYLTEISEAAKQIGAVNTVVCRDGKLYGDNTDFYGMTALIRRAGIEVAGKKVLILGTGGTSKTARAVMAALGATEIITVSRHSNGGAVSYADAVNYHADAQIVINTTPVGMHPNEGKSPIDLSEFPSVDGVVDAVYHPLRTDFVLQARALGIRAVGGLYMLCAQGVAAIRRFHEKMVDDAVIDAVYTSVKHAKENIVLIGMPTCGKSTIGKLLAQELGKPFLDSDAEIEKEIGTIPEYIKTNGESAFRDVERRVIENLSKKDSCVIATGGGAVLNAANVHALKRNGTVVFLDRALENLAALPDRPLSADREHLANLFRERMPIYRAAADHVVDGNASPEAVMHAIVQQIKEDESL